MSFSNFVNAGHPLVSSLLQLLIAAGIFAGGHLLISGTPLRARVVARMGEGRFLGAYSLVALVSLVWMMYAYNEAGWVPLWGQLLYLKPVALVVMLIATILVVAGLTTPNPTMTGGERFIGNETARTGIAAITRHPFLWGVVLWALVHFIINGDGASTTFFGSLMLLAFVGTYSINDKRQQKLGRDWDDYAAHTSNIPLLALIQGRAGVRAKSIGWWRLGLAGLIYAALLGGHRSLFGVSPL
ncbi:MAG: NnrU family protein [Pseudomonadota bacterium]